MKRVIKSSAIPDGTDSQNNIARCIELMNTVVFRLIQLNYGNADEQATIEELTNSAKEFRSMLKSAYKLFD